MKTGFARIFAAMLLAVFVAGCDTIKHETAMEWMQRQPVTLDSPP